MFMSKGKVDFGELIHQLRTDNGWSQKKVADKLGIDISLLSKIEHGERFVQAHMIKPLSEIFNLDYRTMQVQLLSQQLEEEFGEQPFIEEAVSQFLNERVK
jgi:transcriptional regulator with XRE-family HTH domain